MLHPVTVRILALAACGWLLACDAHALTLGRARGAVLIGRPLELTIPVTLDSADADGPCAEADLFYGEQKLSRPPTVRWEPGPNREGVLRLSSPLPVDEPMVTVYLRVGCGQSYTRRFVLLSELPPDVEQVAPATIPMPAAGTTARAGQATATAPAAPRTQASPQGAATAAPPIPRRRRDATAPAAVAAPRVREVAPSGAPLAPPSPANRLARAGKSDSRAAAGTGVSRLKLDLLELGPERDPVLRMSTNLTLAPHTDPKARDSAAALWQVLRRTPEEAIQEGLRLQTLDRDIQSLRNTTQQNAAAVTQMRQQVEKVRGERDQGSLLVMLLAALLVALAGLAFWLWRRGHPLSAARWFEGRAEVSEAIQPDLGPVPTAPGALAPQPQGREPVMVDVPLAVAAGAAAAVAAPAVRSPARAPTRAAPSAWSGVEAGTEFQASQGGTVRMVGVQELIDVHDKADFFLSIGQPEQAIAVLENHVHDQVETSALAWMDLLELYHKVGLRAEFERLRSEFIQRFTAQVPDFDHFDQPTNSLENYGRALSRIVALWPSQRVLNVIEESIFRKPGLPGADPFSLEAYRELVLLYNIAKEVAPPDDSLGMNLEYRPTDFPSTSLQPLNVLDSPGRPGQAGQASEATLVMHGPGAEDLADFDLGPMDLENVDLSQYDAEPIADEPTETERARLMIPPSSPRIGLDIDLGDTPPADSAPLGLATASSLAPLSPAASEPSELAAAGGTTLSGRKELPPLDFDTSAFDGQTTEDPKQKGS